MEENSIDETVGQIVGAIVDAAMECVKTDGRRFGGHPSNLGIWKKELDKYQVSEKTREALKARVARSIGAAEAEECRENLRSMIEEDIFYPFQIEANYFWNDAASLGLIVIDCDRLTGNAISLPKPSCLGGGSYHEFIKSKPTSLQFIDAEYKGRGFAGRVFFEDSTLRGKEKCHYGGLGPGHFHPIVFGEDLAGKIIKIFDGS